MNHVWRNNTAPQIWRVFVTVHLNKCNIWKNMHDRIRLLWQKYETLDTLSSSSTSTSLSASVAVSHQKWMHSVTLTVVITEADRRSDVCDSNIVADILCRSLDSAENRTPPGPGAVRDNVGGVGDERSVMCVELTRLVRRTVVVRVTDRWQRTVDHALQTTIHLESAHSSVHLLSWMICKLPTCTNVIVDCNA